MAAITWRNIDAPNLGQSGALLGQAGSFFDKALANVEDVASTQRGLNIQAADEQEAMNTQKAIEAIRAAAPTMDAYNNLDFANIVDQFGKVDREKVFNYFENLDDDIMSKSLDTLQMEATKLDIAQTKNVLAQQASQLNQDKFIDNAAIKISNLFAQGKSAEEIKNSYLPNIAKGKYANEIYGIFNELDKNRNSLTTQQQEVVKHLDAAAELEFQNLNSMFAAETASLDAQYPIDPKLTATAESKTLSDVKSYMSKVAPKEGLVRWGTQSGGEGIYLHERLDTEVNNIQTKMRKMLNDPTYELPVKAIDFAVRSMPVSDSAEMDTSKLGEELLNYAQRIRQNDLNLQARTSKLADISERKHKANQAYLDALKSNPVAARNLFKE